MPNYVWKRIEPLSEEEKAIDLAGIAQLYETWRESRKRLQSSSSTKLWEFNQRLVRRLSVETGILERLYDLDRGTTEALVAQGFAEDLVGRSNTNVEPALLIDILRDQESAIHLVMDCVANNRPLTKSLIHELHAILTEHQDTTSAVDQFGNRMEIPLLKGRYKEQLNNPRRPEGTVHEYCPPIHVESEMDAFLGWVETYRDEDPVIVAAWAHHRFTQIHPYQDGNGRLSRALTTMVLFRTGLLPLVIDRNMRTEYIQSLESADLGSLGPLAQLFARLERHAILQASSVDVDADIAHHASLTSAVISSLQDKFGKRRLEKLAVLTHVNEVALELRKQANLSLNASFEEIRQTVANLGKTESVVKNGGTDLGNGHWYRSDVITSAKQTETFANFAENHYFTKATVRVEVERLVFVVSFHHVGRELTGIMEATAFSRLETYENSEDYESVSERFSVCSVSPFVFTHQTDARKVQETFNSWLDASLSLALKEFGDRL